MTTIRDLMLPGRLTLSLVGKPNDLNLRDAKARLVASPFSETAPSGSNEATAAARESND